MATKRRRFTAEFKAQVAMEALRGDRHLCFELRCEPAPFRRHLVGPPPGQGYTLTTCPVFQDHLNHTVLGYPLSPLAPPDVHVGYATSFSNSGSPSRYASPGVRPPSAECGRTSL